MVPVAKAVARAEATVTTALRDGTGAVPEKGTVVSLALADELFLVTRDLQSGKAKLSDPALGIGLSAALLSELVFSGSLVVSDGRIGAGERPPPTEQLAQTLYEQTRDDLDRQDVLIRGWLSSHRRLVVDLVADRMVRVGVLRREQYRRLGRTVIRFFPTKPTEAFIRVQRLASYLRTRSEISTGDALLVALIDVLAPGDTLLDIDETDREYLRRLIPLLPAPLREILDATESSIQAAPRTSRA